MKKKVVLPVGGMNCAACAAAVEKSLRSSSGVENVRVNFATRRTWVEYDPDLVREENLVKAVEAAGYFVPETGREE